MYDKLYIAFMNSFSNASACYCNFKSIVEKSGKYIAFLQVPTISLANINSKYNEMIKQKTRNSTSF